MSSFVRRTSAAALAFGVVTGSFALSASAFADDTAESPAATATPTESPSTPGTEPAAPQPADQEQQGPSATPSKPSYTPDERVEFMLAGFAPNTAFTATVTGEDGVAHPVQPPAEGHTTDDQGGYHGDLGIEGGGLPVGRYTVTFTQEGGATAGFEITVQSAEAPAPQGPAASAVKPSYLPNEHVEFYATGFTPGATVEADVTFPDGQVLTAEGEDWTVDDTGAVAGSLEYTAQLPVGSYSVRLYQQDGVEATFTFEVVAEGQQGGQPAPSTEPGTGTGAREEGGQLATTGPADAFGPAGLGLLLAASGAAAMTGRRLLTRRG
ncbi:MAG: hypothetical protein Q4E05_06000 [Pseudoclavibacter sp.]|nr:hypothetical protein [Pseudoclavibacter sp.]